MSHSLPVDLQKVDPTEAWQPWSPDEGRRWSAALAAHLFRRAAFGARPAEIDRAVKEGFPATLDRLLRGGPEAARRAEMLDDLGEEFARGNEPAKLRGWWLYAMLNSGHPLREKLTLFWHNHFATSINKVHLPQLMLRQNQLLRKHALGSFRPFLKEMGRDVAMLIWLDANQNVKAHPNENYAREVMELFTLGVGNYTEKDVQEAARAFTGWHADSSSKSFEFNAAEHDDGVKTVLGRTGKWRGDDMVGILLDRPAAAQFLVNKLYRDLVSETQPPKALLEPLAERFRKSDYDIADLVKTVLGSRLFFSDHSLWKRVKSPVEFVLGAVQSAWEGPVAPTSLVSFLESMGQVLFAPPNVKGWPGGRVWLNNAALLARNNFAEWVAVKVGGPNTDERARFGRRVQVVERVEDDAADAGGPVKTPDLPEPLEKFDISLHTRRSKAVTPQAIVAALAEQLLPGAMNPAAAAKLETFIGEGNPPEKERNRRIREAAHAVMCMPEYQLA